MLFYEYFHGGHGRGLGREPSDRLDVLDHAISGRHRAAQLRRVMVYAYSLHLSRLVQGRVSGSSQWLGLTRRA